MCGWGAARKKVKRQANDAGAMCESYFDKRLNRWRDLEELNDEELEALLQGEVKLPANPVEPRRKPIALVR